MVPLPYTAPREQQTTMFSGGWGAEKVWLNGEFLHEKPYGVWNNDYQDFFPVTLKQGTNVLLVGLYNPNQLMNVVSLFNVVGFFGFAPDRGIYGSIPWDRFHVFDQYHECSRR